MEPSACVGLDKKSSTRFAIGSGTLLPVWQGETLFLDLLARAFSLHRELFFKLDLMNEVRERAAREAFSPSRREEDREVSASLATSRATV